MSRTQTVISSLILGSIIVATGAACSLLSPGSAPFGLQQQIAQGAKADAEGRAQSPVAPAGVAPAAPVAGGLATAPATVSGPSPAQAGTPSPTAPAEVPGTDITAIGDSVMLASSMSLQQAFPGIYVDAAISRHTFAGLDILKRLADRGQLRPVVIVGLGTNGGVTTGQVRQLMAIVGRQRKVILVNTFVPLSYERPTNSALAAAARAYPNVVLANWDQAISDHVNLLWPDRIHPHYPAGTRVYAAMVKAAVDQAP
jgi:hypothetical protein